MKRFLVLVILFAVLLVSCAPPVDSSTYVSEPTPEPEESGFMNLYVGRSVDLEYGYLCYYQKFDGGIWCVSLGQ